MENTHKQKTIVVFEHSISLDEFPQIMRFSKEDLTEMLNDSVIKLFQLREQEEKLNENGTHSFIRIVEVM